ncbi:ribonuclease H protein, partial [Trifolium medium]|nr:ribonuclease H protein [Trifolium medium]
ALVIKEVIWCPPLSNWIKGNTDGVSTNISSSCGGIFRNCQADFVGCFAKNLGTGTTFQAELAGVMRAIEIAH